MGHSRRSGFWLSSGGVGIRLVVGLELRGCSWCLLTGVMAFAFGGRRETQRDCVGFLRQDAAAEERRRQQQKRGGFYFIKTICRIDEVINIVKTFPSLDGQVRTVTWIQ